MNKYWTDAERKEMAARHLAGESWAQIAAAYGTTAQAAAQQVRVYIPKPEWKRDRQPAYEYRGNLKELRQQLGLN